MHNCDSGDTNYRFWSQNHAGECKTETTLIRTGGLSDGTTPLSYKFTTFANAEYPHLLASTPEFSRWNDTVNSAITVTVEILTDTGTKLTDGEIWIDVNYLGSGSFPIATRISDAKADVLATAADQTASTVTGWDNSNIASRANLTLYTSGTSVIKVASNPDRVFFCTSTGTTGASEAAGFATAVDGGSVTDATASFRAAIRQKLSVTFTPQEKGWLQARVFCAKASSTSYVDLIMTVT